MAFVFSTILRFVVFRILILYCCGGSISNGCTVAYASYVINGQIDISHDTVNNDNIPKRSLALDDRFSNDSNTTNKTILTSTNTSTINTINIREAIANTTTGSNNNSSSNSPTGNIDSLLQSFLNEQQQEDTDENEGGNLNDFNDNSNTSSNTSDINDIRSKVVQSQIKVCESIKTMKQQQENTFNLPTTSISMGISYEYDVTIKAITKKENDALSQLLFSAVATKISESVQQFLIASYIVPYCSNHNNSGNSSLNHTNHSIDNNNTTLQLYQQPNDFRSLANNNDNTFSEFVRSIGIGTNEIINTNDNYDTASNHGIRCSNGDKDCTIRLVSTNIIYYDDAIDSNLLNEIFNVTIIQETILSSVSTAFQNATIVSSYNNGKNGNHTLPTISSLQFIHGYAATASIRPPNENNVPNDTRNSQGRNDNNDNESVIIVLSVISSIAIGIILIYLIIVGLRKLKHRQLLQKRQQVLTDMTTNLDENNCSTTNEIKGIARLFKKKRRQRQLQQSSSSSIKLTVYYYFQKKWSDIQYYQDVRKNQRNGRIELKDDTTDEPCTTDINTSILNQLFRRMNHKNTNGVIRKNDTMESVCSASFNDEFGMEVVLQQIHSSNEGGNDDDVAKFSTSNIDKVSSSSLFDPTDAFLSNYNYSFTSSNVGLSTTNNNENDNSASSWNVLQKNDSINGDNTMKYTSSSLLEDTDSITNIYMDHENPSSVLCNTCIDSPKQNTSNNSISYSPSSYDSARILADLEISLPYDEELNLSPLRNAKNDDDSNENTIKIENNKKDDEGLATSSSVSLLQCTLTECSIYLNTTLETVFGNRSNSKGNTTATYDNTSRSNQVMVATSTSPTDDGVPLNEHQQSSASSTILSKASLSIFKSPSRSKCDSLDVSDTVDL